MFYMDINSETLLFSQCMKHSQHPFQELVSDMLGHGTHRRLSCGPSHPCTYSRLDANKNEAGITKRQKPDLLLHVFIFLYLKKLEFIMHFFQI